MPSKMNVSRGKARLLLPFTLAVLALMLGLDLSGRIVFAGLSAQKSPAYPLTNSNQLGAKPEMVMATGRVDMHRPAAGTSVLYDQYDDPDPSGLSSQNFETQFDNYDDQAADDFAVPAGETWIVNQVEAAGLYRGNGPAASMNIFFYHDSNGLPATPVLTQTNLTYYPGPDPGDVIVPLNSPATLQAGVYSLSIQANQNYYPNGQWLWATRADSIGNQGAWRNPRGGFGPQYTGWWICNFPWYPCRNDRLFRIDGSNNGTPAPTMTALPPTVTPAMPIATGTQLPPPPIITQEVPITPNTPTGTATPAPPCGLAWRIVPSAGVPSQSNILRAISVLAADDVWAVGNTGDWYIGGQTLTEHWDGASWTVIPSPSVGGNNDNHLLGVAAVAPDNVWAVGDGNQQTLILHWDGTQWSIVPSPSPVNGSSLVAITVVSPGDLWAAGTGNGPLIEHWDGNQWTVATIPNPPPSRPLLGITAIAANDIWAVGGSVYGTSPLTLHWDGVSWSAIPGYTPPGAAYSILYSVNGTASNDVSAVGAYQINGFNRTLVEHWDGSQWGQVASPNPDLSRDNQLYSVVALAASDVWAVGSSGDYGHEQPVVEHWDGSSWSLVGIAHSPSPDDVLFAVDAASMDDLFAAGLQGDMISRNVQTLVERYNDPCATTTPQPTTSTLTPTATSTCALAWRITDSPNPGAMYNWVYGLASVSLNDVWAVGYSYTNGNPYQALTEHWDGTQWSVEPNPSRGTLQAVSAVSSADIWAVGHYSLGPTVERTLIEHWDGSQWLVLTSPNPSSTYNYLFGISALASDDIWAVGTYTQDNSGSALPLLLHWNGVVWSQVPGPLASGAVLNSVKAVGPNDAWAVGRYLQNNSRQALTIHWDGVTWTQIPNPLIQESELFAVDSVSANDVWAVGSDNYSYTLTEHWDGSQWLRVPSPNVPGADYLNGVSALSSNDVWAVGYGGSISGYQTLAVHWDGGEWAIISSPNPPDASASAFEAITALDPSNIWAGGYALCPGCTTTLIEQNSSPCPPTPSATATPTTIPRTATPPATPTTCAITFSDVQPGSTFYPYIHCLACLGIISGYDDGTFRPGNNVTRGQAAKILANSAGYQEPIPPDRQTFEDVAPGTTFWVYIERVALHGAISGYQCGQPPAGLCVPPLNRPYFLPANNMTRGQLAKIDSNAKGYNDQIPSTQQTFEDVPSDNTFWLFIERVYLHGVINGYQCGQPPAGQCVPPLNRPYFLPYNDVTRGQAAKIVSNTFFPDCSPPSK